MIKLKLGTAFATQAYCKEVNAIKGDPAICENQKGTFWRLPNGEIVFVPNAKQHR